MPAQEYQRTVQFQPTQVQEQFQAGQAVAPTVLDNPAAQDLMAFSKTLADAGKDFVKKKREQRDMEMYNKALESDNPDEVSQQIQGVKTEMDQDYAASNELARAVANDGEPEAAVTLRNLTGRDRWYYAKGLAEKVAQRHLGWSQQQMADPNRVFAGGPKGTFTATDAARDPVLQQVAMKQLRMELLKTHGIENMKPEFFNEWAGKTIRENEAKLIQESRTAKINYDGQQAREVAVSTFQQEVLSDPQKAMANLFTNMQAARNGKGAFMTPNEIWNDANNTIVELAKAGKIDIAVLEDLKKAPIPGDPKGRTYGDLYGARFTDLTNDINQARRQRYNNERSDDTQRAREAYDAYIKQVGGNPELADPRAIHRAKQQLIASGVPGSVVDSVWGSAEETFAAYSPERAKHLEEVARLDQLSAEGKLMPWHLEGTTDETKRKYARAARANMQNDNELKTVREGVGKIPESGVKPIRDGEFDFATNIMKADLLREWEVLTKGYMDTQKLDQYAAGRLAAKELNDRVARGRNDPNSDYYQNPAQGGRFTNYVQRRTGGTENQVRNFNERYNTRLRILEREGGRAFEQAELFFDKTDIEKIQNLAENDPFFHSLSPSDPLYSKVALARSVAQRTGTTLPRIIQRQSNALGMGVVDTQSIYEQNTKPLSSKTLGAVNRIINSTASQQDLAAFNAYQAGGVVPVISSPNDPMFLAIGINEGTRRADGGFNEAYYGHTDPGDQKWNRGTVSARAGTPEQADNTWMNKLANTQRQYEPQLKTFGLTQGSGQYNDILFNILDLTVQAPAAVPDFVKQIPQLITQGITPQSIGRARANAFFNPRTGKLEASGFGNNFQRLLQDQVSRAGTFRLKRRGF